MTAIIDYGMGNLFSLASSLKFIGTDAVVTSDKKVIGNADRLILPGVGAFRDAAARLRKTELDVTIKNEASHGKPLLGICLGMQLLFDKSLEYGEYAGLSLIPGVVRPIAEVSPNLKIPQIGWNRLRFVKETEIFSSISDGEYMYFVHSYYADCDGFVTADTEYGANITASVQNKNVYGCQFHPEKSGSAGLEILKAFTRL